MSKAIKKNHPKATNEAKTTKLKTADHHPKIPEFPSAFDLIGKCWDLVQKNMQVFAIVYAFPALLTIIKFTAKKDGGSGAKGAVAEFGSSMSFGSYVSVGSLGMGLALGLLFLAIMIFVQVMTVVLQKEVAFGNKPTINQIFDQAKRYWAKLFLLNVVTAVIIIIGFICLIIPGIIFIRKYLLAPYAMVDRNLGVGDSLKASSALTRKNTGLIWGVIGVTILLSFVGGVPVIGSLLSFVAGTIYSLAPALRYKQMKDVYGLAEA